MYGKVYKYQNKIIGLPHHAHNIVIFEKNGKTRFVPLPDEIKKCDENFGFFWDAEIQDNIMYLIGYCVPYILMFDLEKEVIIKYIILENLYIGKRKQYFGETISFDDCIIIPECEESAVVIFNKKTEKYIRKKIHNCGKGFSAIIADNEIIWIFPRGEGKIVKWFYLKNEMVFISNAYHVEENSNIYFWAKNFEKDILIIPHTFETILSINKISNKITDMSYLISNLKNDSGIACLQRETDNLMSVFNDGEIVFVNYENGTRNFKLYISDIDVIRYFFKMNRSVDEKNISLEIFLKEIKNA